MFQHLLDLLLSAKSGVLAGVLLIGTTGALVTATVQNGVTTVTITQASASPTGTASTSTATASPTATATASPSSSPSSSPLAAGSPSACADEAHRIAGEVQRVNGAFSKFHTDLEHMRKDSDKASGKSTIENAGNDLQQIRQDAVKAIHATKTCGGTSADEDKDKSEDQDEDNDNDNEESSNHAQGNFLLVFLTNLLGHTATTTTTTTTSPSPTPTSTATATATATTAPVTTFTGSDPKAIADQAIAAMQVVFDNAVAELASPTASPNTHRPAPTAKPEHTRRPDPSNKHSEGHD